jgi:ribosome maturation factor RimP
VLKKKTTEIAAELLAPFLEKEGYELYRLEYVKEGRDWFLRVFIETAPQAPGEWPGNVTTDDCEKVSRYLSEKLDETDPIEQNYYLEVSSPGMDRPLLREIDFIRYGGQLVDVKLYESIGGKKNLTGKLIGSENGILKIEDENGKLLEIPKDKVSITRLSIVF